jgi:hypothetical protein
VGAVKHQEPRLLYLSFNGVLEPLGYSQVARVLMGLAARGLRYHLITFERRQDLADSTRVAALRAELSAHGVSWTCREYARGAGGAVANLARLTAIAGQLCRKERIALVHARGYQASSVALALKRLLRIPYVFDARGRWVDERLAGKRWFTRPSLVAAARATERALYANAAGVVTLTRLHATDIINHVFGAYRGQPLQVVTTCADYADFQLDRRLAEPPRETDPRLAKLADKRLFALIGSNNVSYRQTEAIALARSVLQLRQDYHLVVLTTQTAEFERLLTLADVPPDRFSVASVQHRDMPQWLARIEWAIQLLSEDVAKRGSMPTKLAEFFAAGVRPVHFGCNSEVTHWVERAGSGYVLPSLDPLELQKAAELVASARPDAALLRTARDRTAEHFDLAGGLQKYDVFLQRLLGAPSAP